MAATTESTAVAAPAPLSERAAAEPDRASRELVRILADAGVMAEEDLLALVAKYPGEYLGDVLVRHEILLERYVHSILARALRVPCVSIDGYEPEPELLAKLSEGFCRRHRVFPVCRVRRFLSLAVVNPLDTETLQRVEAATGLAVRPVLCSRRQLSRTLDALRDDQ
jgi:type IV pilus assembly protein PilB